MTTMEHCETPTLDPPSSGSPGKERCAASETYLNYSARRRFCQASSLEVARSREYKYKCECEYKYRRGRRQRQRRGCSCLSVGNASRFKLITSVSGAKQILHYCFHKLLPFNFNFSSFQSH